MALLQRVIGMVQHGGGEIYEAVTLVMVGTNDRARRTFPLSGKVPDPSRQRKDTQNAKKNCGVSRHRQAGHDRVPPFYFLCSALFSVINSSAALQPSTALVVYRLGHKLLNFGSWVRFPVGSKD